MAQIIRTNDEIYKAVSKFYTNKRLDKHEFIKRLKMIRSLIDGDETMYKAIDWIYITEEIELHATSSNEEIHQVKRDIREEIKGILDLLNIKASRNQLTDRK